MDKTLNQFVIDKLKLMFPYAKIKTGTDENTFCIYERIANEETLSKLKKMGFTRVKNAETIKKTPFIWCYL